jgi:copper chaperone
MLTLNVPDMSCGHCVQAIMQALTTLDPMAEVQVDLEAKTVKVRTNAADAAVRAAIAEAGYTPS